MWDLVSRIRVGLRLVVDETKQSLRRNIYLTKISAASKQRSEIVGFQISDLKFVSDEDFEKMVVGGAPKREAVKVIGPANYGARNENMSFSACSVSSLIVFYPDLQDPACVRTRSVQIQRTKPRGPPCLYRTVWQSIKLTKIYRWGSHLHKHKSISYALYPTLCAHLQRCYLVSIFRA
jgi:hypothetical protein